jgi:hypothetical protein
MVICHRARARQVNFVIRYVRRAQSKTPAAAAQQSCVCRSPLAPTTRTVQSPAGRGRGFGAGLYWLGASPPSTGAAGASTAGAAGAGAAGCSSPLLEAADTMAKPSSAMDPPRTRRLGPPLPSSAGAAAAGVALAGADLAALAGAAVAALGAAAAASWGVRRGGWRRVMRQTGLGA